MKGEVVADNSIMFDNNNNKTPGVSSKIKVALQTNETQENDLPNSILGIYALDEFKRVK